MRSNKMKIVKFRDVRGSSWFLQAKYCRLSYRNRNNFEGITNSIGFRAVCLPRKRKRIGCSLRGGSWCFYDTRNCRIAIRCAFYPDQGNTTFGFRTVRIPNVLSMDNTTG